MNLPFQINKKKKFGRINVGINNQFNSNIIFNHLITVKYFFSFINRIIFKIFVQDTHMFSHVSILLFYVKYFFYMDRLLRFPHFRKLRVKFIHRTEPYFCCYSFQKLQAKRSLGRVTLYS